jgi:hypothetical protein
MASTVALQPTQKQWKVGVRSPGFKKPLLKEADISDLIYSHIVIHDVISYKQEKLLFTSLLHLYI